MTILISAGALVLGKTVTTEFAYLAPGPTRNPHNLEHTPGGSSSGSPAAVLCDGWTVGHELPPLILGVPEGPYLERVSEEGLSHFGRTCDRLSDAGFQIQSVEMLTDFEAVMERHNTLVAAEAAMVHRGWFQNHSDKYHEKTSQLINRGHNVNSDLLEACRAGREKLRAEIPDKMFLFFDSIP